MSRYGPLDLSAEDQLVLGLARTWRNSASTRHIRDLLAGEIDWQLLSQKAAHHRVIPLLYQSLENEFAELTPPAILEQLKQTYSTIATRNLFLLAELKGVMELIQSQNIDAIPYKGPIAALSAYNNLCLRQFGDIDILIDPKDYARARKLFLSRGFRAENDWGWETSLVNEQRGTCVDLHLGLAPDVFPVRLKFEKLRANRESMMVAGLEVGVLCPEHFLLILCVQLVKDAWGENALRLSKVCDIAELLRSHPQMNWQAVRRLSRAIGCERIVYSSLTVAHELLDAPEPDPELATPGATAHVSEIVQHVYKELLQLPASNNDLTPETFAFRLRERWRDKLYPHFLTIKQRVMPNERDRAWITLPKYLGFLYFLIRPFRLITDYAKLLVKSRNSA